MTHLLRSHRKPALLFGLVAFLVRDARAGAAIEVGTASSLINVFPATQPNHNVHIQLSAARGEWEAAQIVVRSVSPVHAIEAEASPLSSRTGHLPPPRLYRVGYVDVKTPSNIESRPGRFPDPLIPDVDAYVGEKRRAFPFGLPANESHAIWVQVFVPHDARPGHYAGTVELRAAHVAPLRVAVDLEVFSFELPKSASLPVTFGLSGRALGRGHPGRSEAELRKLLYWYNVSALRHRVSLHGGSMDPPPFSVESAGMVLDFAAYDAEVGPFLDGTTDRDGPAEGARFAAIDLRVPHRLTGDERQQYVRALIAHMKSRGWLDRAFAYLADEPRKEELSTLRERGLELLHTTPDVWRLATTEPTQFLTQAINLFCPTVYRVEGKELAPSLPAPEPGERRWWYQSCLSHGCNIVGGVEFTGWPSYVIDAAPVAQRILEWMTFQKGLQGELYYNTVEAYLVGIDPWKGSHLHGGNGDGTLLYPGRPSTIGGHTDVPVESLRFERIRDGMEDYEYLKLYAEHFGKATANELVTTLAPHTYRFDHNPEHLLALRQRIARSLMLPSGVPKDK
jgi:hypothetical protein